MLKNVIWERGIGKDLKIFMSTVFENTLFRNSLLKFQGKVNYLSNQRLSWTQYFKNIQQNICLNNFRMYLNCNHFHNILRLFNVLPNFPFTTSETMRDHYF